MRDSVTNTVALRIQTLGLFQVWRQENIIKWPTQKSKALFQILLVEPGRSVSTDQILEYLWPDLPPSKAQNNLWVTVSQLRRLLQPDLLPRAHSLYIHKKEDYVPRSTRKITSISNDKGMRMAKVSFSGVLKDISIEWVPEAGVGDYVIVHAGSALTILNKKEAEDTIDLFRQITSQ